MSLAPFKKIYFIILITAFFALSAKAKMDSKESTSPAPTSKPTSSQKDTSTTANTIQQPLPGSSPTDLIKPTVSGPLLPGFSCLGCDNNSLVSSPNPFDVPKIKPSVDIILSLVEPAGQVPTKKSKAGE